MREFVVPDFLKNHSADDIQEKMQHNLPPDIDISEGSHEWNMTRPSALLAAELYQFILPKVIQLIFPDWSYGEYLDAHGRRSNTIRRPATAATGVLTITGAPNTEIPKGSIFSTASVSDVPTVDYSTTEYAKIPLSGTVDVVVKCTNAGTIGNTLKGTIVIVASKLSGITSVTNKEDVVGGTNEESDESLQQRIQEYDATQGQSFVGNNYDYKRWAMSVPGIGDAIIIPPSEKDDSGVVTIVLTDANGAPANGSLIKAVNDYIMRPDEPMARLAPPNAKLNVVAPSTMSIAVKATIELSSGFAIENVKNTLLANIAKYLPQAMDDKEIKYTRIARILSETIGVNDYSGLQIGVKSSGGAVAYGVANIPVKITELPTLNKADLTVVSGAV